MNVYVPSSIIIIGHWASRPARNASVDAGIYAAHPQSPLPLVETHLLSWPECGFLPEGRLWRTWIDAIVELWLADAIRAGRGPPPLFRSSYFPAQK